jgi:hypothetical protein
MIFQLLNLVIWPKNVDYPPRIVEFELGKVNVITGESRTGKSAIIPIIDYCLASGDCSIPIDTIRDYASWYGIVFQTETEKILISRKVPDGKRASNDFYIQRGSSICIPEFIGKPNEKIDGIKNILNAISSMPYLKLEGDETLSYKSRLSFRDLMALIFQTQDIVANQNILFYKTHSHAHREKLRNWFPYILGAEDIGVLQARQENQEIEKRLKHLKREFDEVKKVSKSWLRRIYSEIEIAKEYGLLDIEISDETKAEELLAAVDHLLENIPEYSQTKLKNIEEANNMRMKLEAEEEQLSNDIAVAKKRLHDLKNLKSGFLSYRGSVEKRVERLHISQWMEDVASDSQHCPMCGSSEHPNSRSELKKISSVFEKYESESKKIEEIPTSILREEDRIKSIIQNLLDQQQDLKKRSDLLLSRDFEAQKEFQRSKNMFLFLGHLKASKDTFERVSEGGELKDKIKRLEREHKRLNKLIDSKRIQELIDVATEKISQRILKHLKNLDVENKYKEFPPEFSTEDLSISVLSNDNDWHFLAEVGSASNWVSFHLALICSLQEYFLEKKISCVPTFAIFDQPSQVYFPKLNINGENVGDLKDHYTDNDIIAVKKMFETLALSVLENEGNWQCIVLDHANSDIYGGIEGVYEVDEWRNGNKLIPEEWYK